MHVVDVQPATKTKKAFTSYIRSQFLIIFLQQVVEYFRGVALLRFGSQHLVHSDILIVLLMLHCERAVGAKRHISADCMHAKQNPTQSPSIELRDKVFCTKCDLSDIP